DATVFVSFDVTSPVTYRATSFSESSFGATAELPVGFSQAGSSFSLYSRTPAPGEDSEHGAVIFAGRGSFEGLLAPDRYFFNTGPIGYGAIHQGGGSGFFAAASGVLRGGGGVHVGFRSGLSRADTGAGVAVPAGQQHRRSIRVRPFENDDEVTQLHADARHEVTIGVRRTPRLAVAWPTVGACILRSRVRNRDLARSIR